MRNLPLKSNSLLAARLHRLPAVSLSFSGPVFSARPAGREDHRPPFLFTRLFAFGFLMYLCFMK